VIKYSIGASHFTDSVSLDQILKRNVFERHPDKETDSVPYLIWYCIGNEVTVWFYLIRDCKLAN